MELARDLAIALFLFVITTLSILLGIALIVLVGSSVPNSPPTFETGDRVQITDKCIIHKRHTGTVVEYSPGEKPNQDFYSIQLDDERFDKPVHIRVTCLKKLELESEGE